MTESKKKKETSVPSKRLKIFEFTKKFAPFLKIVISGISGSLICSVTLSIIYLIRKKVDLETYIDSYLILNLVLHILPSYFIGLITGLFISLGIKKSRFAGKKTILILTVLCPFFVYLIFNFIVYTILYHPSPPSVSSFTFTDHLLMSITQKPLRFRIPGVISGYYFTEGDFIFYDCTDYLLRFYYYLTLGKIELIDLTNIINIQVWGLLFLNSFFLSWVIIIRTCPWLFPITSDKKSWISFFIKKLRGRVD